jgi:hypothetical protein
MITPSRHDEAIINRAQRVRVILLKQINHSGRWIPAPALFDSKGRVRRDHVRVKGRDAVHSEGGYFIEWRENGKRVKQSAGPDAFAAAELARRKQAELSAVRNGIIPAAPAAEPKPERVTLAAALDQYSEYIQTTAPYELSAPIVLFSGVQILL